MKIVPQSTSAPHDAMAKRTVSSRRRTGAAGPLVFAGGVAENAALVEFVRIGFAGEALVPAEAQTVGALG